MKNINIEIKGSQDEGGGQIIRTGLTLFPLFRTVFRHKEYTCEAEEYRPDCQDLPVLLTATAVGNTEVEGDHFSFRQLSFKPVRVVGGDLQFSIGTAGSYTLISCTLRLL